jgi:hypothetical protein
VAFFLPETRKARERSTGTGRTRARALRFLGILRDRTFLSHALAGGFASAGLFA